MLKEKKTTAKPDGTINIIDIILKTQEAELEDKPAKISDQVITPTDFFGKGEGGGHITKKDFLILVKSMSADELKAMAYMFDQMTLDAKLESNPYASLDKDKREYLWINFPRKRGKVGLKIMTAGKLFHFIGLYQFGVFKVNLSLESLYKEALNQA